MASVIPNVGDGDIVGRDGGSDGIGSFHEVNNWLGSSSYATEEGRQQSEAPLVESSPAPRCSMGCSLAEKKWYMNTQGSCIVKDSEVQKKINDRKAQLKRSWIQRQADLNHFEGDTEVSEFCSDNSVHSDGSADEAVQMEIDSASEEDRPSELTTLVKYVKNPGISDEEEEDEVDLPYLLKKPKSNKKKMKDRMIKRQKTREKTEYSKWMITPNYSEKLEENKCGLRGSASTVELVILSDNEAQELVVLSDEVEEEPIVQAIIIKQDMEDDVAAPGKKKRAAEKKTAVRRSERLKLLKKEE
ncbi:hypothetical protein D1007_01016 [Hordeum vulgare]|nr:hypothetical protein D1007_01016 [Hordeum vulgare]